MLILKKQMQEGKLDKDVVLKDVVLMVENNLTACWKFANYLEK